MQGVSTKLGAAFAACVLAAGIAAVGTAAQAWGVSGENAALDETSADSFKEQSFTEVTLGAYEQDGNESNGAEPIEWYVLDERDGKTLLVSKYVLDAHAYDDKAADVKWYQSSPRPTYDVEWADSSIRAWLNGEFLNKALGDQKSFIAPAANTDTKNNATHTAATAADPAVHAAVESQDNVFLLSVAQAKKYFHGKAARAAKPTAYALSKGVYVGIATDDHGQEVAEESGNAVWWLRTNGYYAGYNAVVTDDGYENHGTLDSKLGGNVGVRPSVWVDSSALA